MAKQKGLDDPKAVWKTKPSQLKNPLYQVCLVAAGPVLPFIRCDYGRKAHSPYFFTFMGIFLLAAESPFFRLFMPVWLGMVAYRRATVSKLEHSEFQGYPYVACMIPWVNTFHRGRWVEPFLVMGGALCLLPYNRLAGGVFLASGFAILMLIIIDKTKMEQIRTEITDTGVIGDVYRRIHEGQSGF